jgi:hypothetical protein
MKGLSGLHIMILGRFINLNQTNRKHKNFSGNEKDLCILWLHSWSTTIRSTTSSFSITYAYVPI